MPNGHIHANLLMFVLKLFYNNYNSAIYFCNCISSQVIHDQTKILRVYFTVAAVDNSSKNFIFDYLQK